MPRESAAARRERTAEIVARLAEAYPDSQCSLYHRSPFELLVATVLSAQCTDVRVNQVTPALFPQAFQFGIDEMLREIDVIANNSAAPTFENTIEAMERSGERLDYVQSIFGVYSSNLSTPEVQAINKEWSAKLSADYDKVNLNGALFNRIEQLYERRDQIGGARVAARRPRPRARRRGAAP